MKKILVVFALFCAIVLMVGCGGSSSQNQGEGGDSERKTGELYGGCYPNKTCNEGLVCEIEENVCVRDSNNSENNDDSDIASEQSDGSNDAETTSESNDDENESTDNPDPTSDIDDSPSDEIDDTTLNDDTNPISGSDEDTDSSEPEPDEDSCDSTSDNDPEPVNPCDPNPCIGIEHSTETCEAVGGTYRCGCKPDYYYWDGYTCGTTETQSAACTGLPYNALWNSVSEIIQTWDNYLGAWVPSSIASYNENPSTNQCKFKCKTGFKWNGQVCLSIGGSLGQTCTGQNSCYDSSSVISCSSPEDFIYYGGQDAYYANQGACAPHNFQLETVVNNTTVKDLNTKLEWKQSVSTEKYSWGDAVSYCENLEYGGHSDWRLPSPHEFFTIANRSRYDPAVDVAYFPNMPGSCTQSLFSGETCTYYDLWTSVEYAENSKEYAFIFLSSTGELSSEAKTSVTNDVVTDNKNYVMCVRGNKLPAASFTVKPIGNDVVVIDSASRLMWQKTYETKWNSAVDYCNNLTYSGYSDWRLPNFNELVTLRNYDITEEPYSDFPDMPSGPFVTSTKNPKKSDGGIYSYLTISFGSSFYDPNSFSITYSIRCVRDMD